MDQVKAKAGESKAKTKKKKKQQPVIQQTVKPQRSSISYYDLDAQPEIINSETTTQ
jgi:hypothetical protein